MQKRHINKALYFRELETTTEKYLIPAIENLIPLQPGMKVAEVGCSIGGNLAPFLKRGCLVYGIDIDPTRIRTAEQLLLAQKPDQVHLFPCDILLLEENNELVFDIIILRDVIEHIHDKNALMVKLKKHLRENGVIYFAFPPWRMPFGGHQQICKSFLSKMPWLHIFPDNIYNGILQLMGEDIVTRASLRENRQTRMSISAFRKLIRKNGFYTRCEITYFINPHYEVKFNLKPRILPRFLRIPWLADFYSTAHSSFVMMNK